MVKKLLMSSALMVLMGATLSPLKAEGEGIQSLQDQARKVIATKLKSTLEQDPQDVEPILDAISIKEGDERRFPLAGALGPIFSELLSSDVRESSLKLLDWAKQDPTEPNHQAVLKGFLNALFRDEGGSPAWAFFKDGHILGALDHPEHLVGLGSRSHYIFHPQDLMDAGFMRMILLFGRKAFGQSEIFPKSELTPFTTSSLSYFELQNYNPEHKEVFEALFPLSPKLISPYWPRLETLWIQYSRLGVDEARHLATFLENSNVKSVNLWGVVDSNSAIVAFISSLSPHTKVEDIGLGSSLLSDEDIIEIGEHLPPTILSVDLSHNYIKDGGIHDFLERVKGKNLEIIKINNNPISDGANLARSLHGIKIRQITIPGFKEEKIEAFAQNLPDTVLQVDLGEGSIGAGTYSAIGSIKRTLKEKYPKIEWL
jgi:hypothetical protein